MEYDLIVIGLGPGGIRAAKRAAEEGLSVLAYEENKIGGCCLNCGCIPTKAILHGNSALKDKIIQTFQKAVESDLIKKGVEIKKERAQADFGRLSVNDIKAKNIVLATGSVPHELKGLEFDGENILNSSDVLNLEILPKSIAIIGSGAIGIEWARIFSNFKVEVSLIEKAQSLLPLMDLSIQRRIARIFKMKKIPFYTGKTALSFENNKLKLNTGEEIKTEKVLVAIGRKKIIPDGLKINPDLTTNFKNVYAIGDIAAKKALAHTASMHADYIIKKITGKNASITPDELIPSVVYGEPEIASIGLNEQDLAPIEDYKIYEMPLGFLPKSWCDGQTDGFIKIISKDDEIKGAHIVSREASSLITQIQIIMKAKLKIQDVKEIVFAHPTYSEGISEALSCG